MTLYGCVDACPNIQVRMFEHAKSWFISSGKRYVHNVVWKHHGDARLNSSIQPSITTANEKQLRADSWRNSPLSSYMPSCTTRVPINNSTLHLHSSGILSLTKIVLNNLVRKSTALSPRHLHSCTGMSSGPTVFQLSALPHLITFLHPYIVSLIFFIHQFIKNAVVLPSTLSHILSSLVTTFPSPPYMTLICCTSFPTRSLCLVFWYKSFSPSLLSSLTCYH